MSRSVRGRRNFGKGNPGQVRAFTMKEMVKQRLLRHLHRAMVQDGLAMGVHRPPYFQFNWTFGDLDGTVYADNRSEARAMIKKDLGVPKKKRLPIDVNIERYDNPKYQEAVQRQYDNLQTCTATSD